MSKSLSQQNDIQTLICVLLNPGAYMCDVNVPDRMDAAQQLYKNHYGELSEHVKKVVDRLVAPAGKNKKTITKNK